MLGQVRVLRSVVSVDQIESFRKTIESLELLLNQDLQKKSIGNAIYENQKDNQKIQMCKKVLEYYWKFKLNDIFEEKFSEKPALCADFCTIRKFNPSKNHIDIVKWHLDANFSGLSRPFLIFWVPLSDVGVDAPGLEFCLPTKPLSLAELNARWTPLAAETENHAFDDSALDTLFGAGGYRVTNFELARGDVLVFDQHVLHRTQNLKTPSKPRISFEFRAFAPTRPFLRAKEFLGRPVVHQTSDGDIRLTRMSDLLRG